MSDLKRRMATGAAWLVLFRLADRGIGFVSTLILARLLVPADFGLVAMGISVLAAVELLGAFSFDLALVRNPNAQRRHYDTAWTFAVMFAIFNAILMCALAHPAAQFFGEPRAVPLMLALAAVTAIQGFDNIGIVAFQKEMELHKEFRLGITRKLAGFVVSVAAALLLQSYWALVAGMFARSIVGLVASYTMHPYRPRLSLEAAGELLRFSRWLLLNNVLVFLNNRGTDFVIGRWAGAGALGTYSVSYELANLPTTELVFPISRAVFPGYSRLAGDLVQLRRAFLEVLSLVALITLPAGAIIGLTAEPLVLVLLGAKWLAAVPLIPVLAAFGILRSLHGPNGSIYLALGRPQLVAVLQCVQLVGAFGLMLWWVPQHGAVGAAWALLVGAFIAMSSNFVVVLRVLNLSFAPFVAVLWRPLSAIGVVAAALHAVDADVSASVSGAGAFAPFVTLLLLSVLGAVLYAGSIWAMWRLAGRPAGAEALLKAQGQERWHRWRGTSSVA